VKSHLEQDDIQAIASAVIETLKPILFDNGIQSDNDTVFDKKSLAAYLHVSKSTISKLVMNKQIPYFKIQTGQSGAVRFRQKDIDKWIQRQTIPDINPFRPCLAR